MENLIGKKILVVEDDFVNQMLIKHSLGSTGALFEIAGNGREAVEILKQKKYDIILMDITMPEMDGFEATGVIRNELEITTPIIAMTGWSSKEEGDKFTRVGMNGCLAKPFGLDDFYKTLDTVLKDIPVSAADDSIPSINSGTEETANLTTNVSIDLTMLYELAGDDNEYKKTIIEMFLKNMPDTIRKMEGAFVSKDWETLYRTAHYAKSSLSVIQSPEMFEQAYQLETKAKNEESPAILEQLILGFKKQYRQADSFLKAELQSLG